MLGRDAERIQVVGMLRGFRSGWVVRIHESGERFQEGGGVLRGFRRGGEGNERVQPWWGGE